MEGSVLRSRGSGNGNHDGGGGGEVEQRIDVDMVVGAARPQGIDEAVTSTDGGNGTGREQDVAMSQSADAQQLLQQQLELHQQQQQQQESVGPQPPAVLLGSYQAKTASQQPRDGQDQGSQLPQSSQGHDDQSFSPLNRSPMLPLGRQDQRINVMVLKANTTSYESMLLTRHGILRYVQQAVRADIQHIRAELDRLLEESADAGKGHSQEQQQTAQTHQQDPVVRTPRQQQQQQQQRQQQRLHFAEETGRGQQARSYRSRRRSVSLPGETMIMGRRFQLHQRDVRQLDFSTSRSREPFIGVRQLVILLKLPPYHCLILKDRCLVLLPFGADSMIEPLLRRLPLKTDSQTPFEFRALDTFMDIVVEQGQSAMRGLEPRVNAVLRVLRKFSTTRELDVLRVCKNETSELESSLRRVQQALGDVLEDDQEMLYMHLSRMCTKPEHFEEGMEGSMEQHTLIEESESLIETYLQDVNDLLLHLQLLTRRITSTESLLMLRLDTTRNSLLMIDTLVAIAAACIATGSMVAGIFGMNLANGHEESQRWFNGVVIVTVVILTALFIVAFIVLRRAGFFNL